MTDAWQADPSRLDIRQCQMVSGSTGEMGALLRQNYTQVGHSEIKMANLVLSNLKHF